MRLTITIGLLLLGIVFTCLPKGAKSQTPHEGDRFYFGGRGYTWTAHAIHDPRVGPLSPEDLREEAAEAVWLAGQTDPNVELPDDAVLDLEEDQAPFDAGLSILLGAGAIAGLKRARARKKLAAAI